VLFSEPKIPQWSICSNVSACRRCCFSALQRAENSSISDNLKRAADWARFQCSSASRKFLNRRKTSAATAPRSFQCSSASRKFLNTRRTSSAAEIVVRFSALQRAENSSMQSEWCGKSGFGSFSALQRAENSSIKNVLIRRFGMVAFQCSSASRKFLNFTMCSSYPSLYRSFSALQRAENSSMTLYVKQCV